MRYQLENNYLCVEIDSFGAELKSVRSKATQKEYLWQGDPKYWGRTSPVLFPFVGSLKNKTYQIGEQTFPMGQHGFARDLEHTCTSQSSTEIWFSLNSSEETLARYPFPFVLEIGYRLEEVEVTVLWRVTNPGQETLPFSIGAHPAFACPFPNEETMEPHAKTGYQLSFSKFEGADGELSKTMQHKLPKDASLRPLPEIHHHGNTLDTGLAITEDLILPLEDGKCKITDDFFDRCTYMFEGNQANEVSILTPSGQPYVSVTFTTPLFAIWSPEKKDAPFLCIEPWYGRCDHVDFAGTLAERAFTNLLPSGETFEAEYAMTFY